MRELLSSVIAELTVAKEGSPRLDSKIYQLTTKEMTAEEQIDDYRKESGREPSDNFKSFVRESEAHALAYPHPYTSRLDTAMLLLRDIAWTWVIYGPGALGSPPVGVRLTPNPTDNPDETNMGRFERQISVEAASPPLAVCLARMTVLALEQANDTN